MKQTETKATGAAATSKVNATPADLQTTPVAPEAAPQGITPERLARILAQLAEPFDMDVISWKPQVTSYKDAERPVAKAVAYADPRAYSDRLNEVVGVGGWTREYTVISGGSFDRVIKQRGSAERVLPNQAKVFVVATVTVHGVGTHTGTGEAWMADENALTIAEAQAFKRACVCFGLGRYLYDIPETDWLPIDKYGSFKIPPVMPDWAVRRREFCPDCASQIKDRTINRIHYTAAALAQRGRDLYGKELCADCQIERAKAAKAAGRVN